MSKGGKQTTTEQVKIDPRIEQQALQNMQLAKLAAAIPYAPNRAPQVAAFTPMQNAAFTSTNQAANAFGLPQASNAGVPRPQTVGGFSGYSPAPFYDAAMRQTSPETTRLLDLLQRQLRSNAGIGKGGSTGKGGAVR